jgi:starch synthase
VIEALAQMEILFVTTELAPFVTRGALADVSAALPKTLKGLGHKVTLVMPRFAAFEEAGLMHARRLTPLHVEVAGHAYEVTVFDGRLPSQVEFILLDAPGLFEHASPPASSLEATRDDGIRFAVFSKAVALMAKQRADAGTPFDVAHLNDWATALVAPFLKDLAVPTPTVLTVHDAMSQGRVPADLLASLGLSTKAKGVLEAGLSVADAVSTVSPAYAQEMQSGSSGHGLAPASTARMVGIVNGVDYGVWNPATQPAIAARYDAEDTSSKMRCKGALQKELGLTLATGAPVLASIGPIELDKGSDLLIEALPRMLRTSDVQVVIVGDGVPALVAKLEGVVEANPGRIAFVRTASPFGRGGSGPSDTLVHRVLAASDLVAVPSRKEPCGAVQLFAQRYGALPVAHATGGLLDTIVDCDAKLETGTGFLFEEPTVDLFYAAVQRALAAFATDRWAGLRRRVMRLDTGWERSARRYEQVYRGVATRVAPSA